MTDVFDEQENDGQNSRTIMTWFQDDDDIVQCEVNSDGLKDGRYFSIDKEDGEIVS